MSVLNPRKIVRDAVLKCGGVTSVTLSFDAEPALKTAPADIVLIMDRSGSMGGAPMVAAKAAAKELIRTVSMASGDPSGQEILGGSHMGLVSFAETASADLALSGEVPALEAAVDALTAGGFTNHGGAFTAAEQLLQASAAPRRVIIMFTDGATNTGPAPDPIAESIRRSGIEIYCIGLVRDDAPLRRWATDPDAEHVAFTSDTAQLQRVFAQVAAEVVQAGALDMVLQETLSPEFRIVEVTAVSHGSAAVISPRKLEWTAGEVGAAGPETASLSFDVMYVGTGSGTRSVNESVVYQDRQGGVLDFPSPEIETVCGGAVVHPEPCPLPVTFVADSCQDLVKADAGETILSGLGRIVQVDAVVKNVCPDKRVAVAVILTELDADGVEHARGSKNLLIPAQGGDECRDVLLKCVSFVVPESLSPAGDGNAICGPRGFRTRVLANYVDSDFVCCDPQTVIL